MASISLKYKSKSGNLTAPAEIDPGAMIPLMTVTPYTTTTTVEFNSIPGNYAHLQLRSLVMGSGYSTLRFNGDTTTSNYRSHYVGGQGSVTFAGSDANQAYFANSGSANGMAVILDLLDYSDTNKYKTQRYAQGWDNNGSGEVYLTSSLWMSTAAITSLKITAATGTFASGSHFALYGIKRAGA
jgi:hypothetical protein